MTIQFMALTTSTQLTVNAAQEQEHLVGHQAIIQRRLLRRLTEHKNGMENTQHTFK